MTAGSLVISTWLPWGARQLLHPHTCRQIKGLCTPTSVDSCLHPNDPNGGPNLQNSHPSPRTTSCIPLGLPNGQAGLSGTEGGSWVRQGTREMDTLVLVKLTT